MNMTTPSDSVLYVKTSRVSIKVKNISTCIYNYVIVYSVWDPGPRTGTRYGSGPYDANCYIQECDAMNFILLGVLFHSASAVHALFVYLRVMSLNINVVNN